MTTPITLPEQQRLIDHYAGPDGCALRITERGYEKRRVPAGLFAWLREQLEVTWGGGVASEGQEGRFYRECATGCRGHFQPEAPSPADSVRMALMDARWDAASPPEAGEVVSLINASDPSYVRVLEELQPLHEAWAGIPLRAAQFWGPRVYRRHAVLARHIDVPTTHVVGGSITLASQLDEPWPLMVERESGEVVEVELEPGEMLLYEGARLPHYRSRPLRGAYYVNLYVHYYPRDATFDYGRGTWVLDG